MPRNTYNFQTLFLISKINRSGSHIKTESFCNLCVSRCQFSLKPFESVSQVKLNWQRRWMSQKYLFQPLCFFFFLLTKARTGIIKKMTLLISLLNKRVDKPLLFSRCQRSHMEWKFLSASLPKKYLCFILSLEKQTYSPHSHSLYLIMTSLDGFHFKWDTVCWKLCFYS